MTKSNNSMVLARCSKKCNRQEQSYGGLANHIRQSRLGAVAAIAKRTAEGYEEITKGLETF